jgi:hypothetical protein
MEFLNKLESCAEMRDDKMTEWQRLFIIRHLLLQLGENAMKC